MASVFIVKDDAKIRNELTLRRAPIVFLFGSGYNEKNDFAGRTIMNYRLVRSRRKTIAICIDRDGGVTVRAPLHAASSLIERFVQEKQRWILEKSGQMQRLSGERSNFAVLPGGVLPFLGKNYPVKEGTSVSFDGTAFFVPREGYETLRPRLESFYREAAKRVIPERVAYFSQKTGWKPAGVRVGGAKTSWGSCSGKNSLNFTWRLILTPPEELDYVVVHELAHLKEHNHSARFWHLVERILPDYAARRAALKELGRELQKFNFG